MDTKEKFQDRFHGEIEFSDGTPMTQKEKNAWLDQKIKTSAKGVYWTERWKKYYATIRIKYKTHFLGEFDTEDQATEARIKAEKFYGYDTGLERTYRRYIETQKALGLAGS